MLHPRHHRIAYAPVILISVLISGFFSSLLTFSLIATAFQKERSAGTFSADTAVHAAIEQVSPAVVSVSVLQNFKDTAHATGPETVGGGSGFIVRADGLIITNRHVIDSPDMRYKITLRDGREFDAKIISTDPILDLGVLKIDALNLPVVKLGNSDSLFVGQSVLAIGNSLAEFQNTVTMGIVSGLGRQVTAGDNFGAGGEVLQSAIQTDAAINPGNSGGPLVTLSGQVVGVTTAVSREGQLIGFAIPINSVRKLIDGVIATGKISHPWLGVRYEIIDEQLATEKKLTQKTGALIFSDTKNQPAIAPGSPAETAGLKENEIVLAVNNVTIDDTHGLADEIAKYAVGDTIELTILDGTNTKKVSLKLTEFPATP